MKPLLIIKTGNTVQGIPPERGDFEDWIADGLALPADAITVADVFAGADLPSPDAVSAAIITGSAAMVTDRLPWSENAAAWLRDALADQLPVLGICYGHQLLAWALGGKVDFHPAGREIGTAQIMLTDEAVNDALFSNMPASFAAQTSHRQVISGLPEGAVVLAGNAFDPYHGVRFQKHAWGVQFHPEFAPDVMLAYLRERQTVLQQEGLDVDALRLAVTDTPQASGLLRRFAELVTAV